MDVEVLSQYNGKLAYITYDNGSGTRGFVKDGVFYDVSINPRSSSSCVDIQPFDIKRIRQVSDLPNPNELEEKAMEAFSQGNTDITLTLFLNLLPMFKS